MANETQCSRQEFWQEYAADSDDVESSGKRRRSEVVGDKIEVEVGEEDDPEFRLTYQLH